MPEKVDEKVAGIVVIAAKTATTKRCTATRKRSHGRSVAGTVTKKYNSVALKRKNFAHNILDG